MTTPEQPATPAETHPMPQQGGAWVRLPDGSLQREAYTAQPGDEPPPEPQPTEE